MKRLICGLVTCFAIVAAGCSSSSTGGTPPGGTPVVVQPSASNPLSASSAPVVNEGSKSILGLWQMPEPKEIPAKKGGGTIQVSFHFFADGKFTMTRLMNGTESSTDEGTYKLEGDKLTITTKVEGMDQARELTIAKITATELTISDTKKNIDTVFVRKK